MTGSAAPTAPKPPRLAARLRARPLRWALPLAALWAAGTAYAFWYFEMRDLRPFAAGRDGRPIPFDDAPLRQALTGALPPGADATLLHLWDPDCPCNRFNAPHVRTIVESYRSRGVRVLALVPPNAPAPAALAAEALRLFGPGVEVARAGERFATVPASPAALVADRGGALAWFGPYSIGALCGAGGNTLVERALDLTLAGRPPGPSNLAAVGCYCPWPRA